MFADAGGGESPTRKAKAVKPQEQLAQVAGAPFMLAGLALTVAGEPELGAVMPLTEPEEKAVADALFTAVKNNAPLMAALERSGNGLSMLHLGITLAAVLQPRVAAIRAVMAERKYNAALSNLEPVTGTGPDPVPAGSGQRAAPEEVADGYVAGPAVSDDPARESEPHGFSRARLRADAVSKAGI